MSTEEKEKYHRLAKEKDDIKSKTNKKVKRFSVNETQENVRHWRMVSIPIQGFAE